MKNLRNESGQALVEMALVLPLLLLLLFGIVEMAMLGFTYITVQNAIGAGANMAVSGGTDGDVKLAVINASPGLTPPLLATNIAIQHTPPNVIITVTYPANLALQAIPGLPNPLNVVATLTEEVP